MKVIDFGIDKALLVTFGLIGWLLVVGAFLGLMQAAEWAVLKLYERWKGRRG